MTQQNETDAVIASGLSAADRVVTTGFANLSDGAKVVIGRDDQTPSADLAPRKRTQSPGRQHGKDGERRGKKGEGDQKRSDRTGEGRAGAASQAAERSRRHDRSHRPIDG